MSRRSGDRGGASFEQAMRGVEPMEETAQRAREKTVVRKGVDPASAYRFERAKEGLSHWGRRADVSETELEALRAGELVAANRLDLHGTIEEVARDRVFGFVRQSSQSGLRCVAVVHGRGLRSADGPVLKQAIPRWLTQLPLARIVGAYASAPRERGGDGVTLVLLRR